LCQFADEFALLVANDGLQAARRIAVSNVDSSRKDNDQAGADLTGREKGFAGGEGLRFTEVPHTLDLDRIERGKHLIVTLFEQRLR
jgi:hypothetical protein